jgi:uncharacterized membrane protein
MASAPDLFSDNDRDVLKAAISEAEQLTSGEVRVYIEDECRGDVLDHAAFIFEELQMHKTELRNGVLIYLATKHKKFAIIGDAGIHAKVGDDFWKSIKEEMLVQFKQEKFVEGLKVAIVDVGHALKTHFPYSKDDTNELPNDVVFGKK